jgi:hypothetical protein
MVKNDRRTRMFFKILLNQFLVGLLMVFLALFILFFARGYRFNYKNFKVVKTGIAYFSSMPKDVEVYIGSNKKSLKTPYTLNLTPGNYDATIRKERYLPWSAHFKVESEYVTEFEDIVLFRDKIESSVLTDQAKIDQINTPTDILAVSRAQNLFYNGYEIWLDNKLVTRFSEPVIKAVWYPDSKHILYQQGEEIRVIESSGKNDCHLITLTTDEPSVFTTNARGDELYYTDSGKYMQAKIR